MRSCPLRQLNAAAPPLLRFLVFHWTRRINKGVCMTDRAKRNPEDQSEDMTRSSADEQIRGVGDEVDEDFDDVDDVDEEEEDEDGTV